MSKSNVQEKIVTVDRRRGSRREEAIVATIPKAAPQERRIKKQRRRQIDPTTCERDYSNDEMEFMHALDDYKRAAGRMFPTCSEILEVIRDLGYVRVTSAPSVSAETLGSVDEIAGTTAS